MTLAPAPQAKYASTKMADRRARILKAARKYVADVGYESVTTRGLAERAGVSPATLFNIYGSKEALIAASVEDHLAGFLGRSGPPLTSVGQLIASIKRMPKEIIALAPYSEAMVAIYFSSETDNPVRDTLRETAQSKQSALFHILKERGELADWIDPAALSDQITNGLFAVIHDWAIGRLSDADLGKRLLSVTLVVLAAATKGAAAGETARMIDGLDGA